MDLMGAPVIHDFLYRYKKVSNRPISREEADLVFLDLMREDGVSGSKALCAYWAVRLFGKIAWRKAKPKKQ